MAVGKGSISAQAAEYNDLPLDAVIQGTRLAALFDRKVKEAEIKKEEQEKQEPPKETPIVTPQEIEDERYR